MLIKTKKYYFVILYFLMLSITPVGMYFKDSSNLIFSIVFECLVIIFSIYMFYLWKKKNILFESTEKGINIIGSKEGKYDPDFIEYEKIEKCEMDRNRIVIKLYDERYVILKNLGKD